MNKNSKQNFLNLSSNLLALVIQFAINFVIVPQIIGKFGTEAIGYINVSNDIVSYFYILTVIFNSVAARFISIEINNNNNKKADEYYNSVILANGFLSMIIAFVGLIFIPNVDKFLNVTPKYLTDVKIAFLLTWVSFIISLLTSIFTVGTYVKNRLDINAVRNIVSYILKVIVLIVMFTLLSIKIYFIPIATLVSTVFLGFANYSLTKKLLPDIKVDIRKATVSSIKTIATSGIWMSFTALSGILISGLDNVIANLLFGQVAMGNLSTSRTLPNAIGTIITTIGVMFTPTFVSLYSKGKTKEIVEQAKSSIKINGLIVLVPVTGIIAFANEFYSLWLKNTDKDTIRIIAILSSITLVQQFLNGSTAAIAQIPVVTNDLKLPGIISLASGVLNIICVLIVAKTTNLGIFTLSLSSTIIMSLRYILFNSWYAGKVLNVSSKPFYLSLLKTSLPAPILLVLFRLVATTISCNTWVKFIIVVAICGIMGYVIGGVMILSKQQIKLLYNKAKGKLMK